MKVRATVVAFVLVGLLASQMVSAQTQTSSLQVIQDAITELQATLAKLIAERDRLLALQPVPVDCVGTWSAWTTVAGSCSACTSSGTQTCTEQRTFTVTTQPANGGQACPASPETRSVTQVCTPPPVLVETCNPDGTGNGVDEDKDGLTDEICTATPAPAPSGDFDTLCQSAAKLACYSLRDDAQLNLYKHSNARLRKVFYLYPNDPDPRRQDAAKITVDTSSNSLTNQVRLPIPAYSGSLLVQWDAWMGTEFRQSISGIPTYKHFQLASGGNIWTEVRSRFSAATSGNVALVDLRYYGIPGPGFFVGGMDALSPMVGSFHTAPEVWTRYWMFLKPAGSYYELSLWVADVNRDPVLILDRALVQPKSGYRWDSFWLEYNTSTDLVKAGRPDLISYARNLVMLHGISDPTPYLIRP
jgi:hypothetical protein